MKRAAYTKKQIIGAFEARYNWYRAVNKAQSGRDWPSQSVASANEISAWMDYQFILKGKNWRLALPHDGVYPYTTMLAFNWHELPVN